MTDHLVPRYFVLETDLNSTPHLTLGGIPNVRVVKEGDCAALDAERLLLEQQLCAITLALKEAGIKDDESGSDFVTRLANERQRLEELLDLTTKDRRIEIDRATDRIKTVSAKCDEVLAKLAQAESKLEDTVQIAQACDDENKRLEQRVAELEAALNTRA